MDEHDYYKTKEWGDVVTDVCEWFDIEAFSSPAKHVTVMRGNYPSDWPCIQETGHNTGFTSIDLLPVLKKLLKTIKLS